MLVVDDSDAQRYAMCRNLRAAGFETIEGRTGAEALRRAAARPDVILLDVGLPDVSGIEICHILKKHSQTKDIPVIQMSATYTLERLRFEPLRAGAEMYLESGVDAERLASAVRQAIESQRGYPKRSRA